MIENIRTLPVEDIIDGITTVFAADRFLSAARDATAAAEEASKTVRWKRRVPPEPIPTAGDTDHGSLH